MEKVSIFHYCPFDVYELGGLGIFVFFNLRSGWDLLPSLKYFHVVRVSNQTPGLRIIALLQNAIAVFMTAVSESSNIYRLIA